MDVDAIFERVSKDTSLLAEIDIEELLRSVNNEKHDYLENKTLDTILDENICAIKTLKLPKEETNNICNRLVGYRYVENLYELHKGKHIRWIRSDNKKLTNGAIILDVKFFDNGSHILCRNAQHRLFQVKFNDCMVFQKLSTGEQLILMAYEHMRAIDVSE
jgi:hypothetical protein